MDESTGSRVRDALSATAPFVVVFLRKGDGMSARVRDVRSQEQWIIDDAAELHDLLMKPR